MLNANETKALPSTSSTTTNGPNPLVVKRKPGSRLSQLQQQSLQQQAKRIKIDPKKDVFVSPILLGEGSNSQVFLGKLKDGQKVAVKSIRKRSLLPHQVEELRNEISILSVVSGLHPNICPLHCVREDEETVQLVFDLNHCSLLDLCCESGALPELEAKNLFFQVADAVHFLHNISTVNFDGVCHRDLKLENLMLTEDRTKVVLIDFGFSTFIKNKEKLGKLCGSFHYVAPEIVKQQPYDGRKVDVWALGCVLFSMVTGRQPFDAKGREALFTLIKQGSFHVPDHLSSELKELLKGMLEVNPSKRLSIDEVKEHSWFNKKP